MSDLSPDLVADLKSAAEQGYGFHVDMDGAKLLAGAFAELERALSLANDASGTIEAALLDARRENAEQRKLIEARNDQIDVYQDQVRMYEDRLSHEPRDLYTCARCGWTKKVRQDEKGANAADAANIGAHAALCQGAPQSLSSEARSLLELAECAFRTQHNPPSNWRDRVRVLLANPSEHVWNADGDHCLRCGASDWMAVGCKSPETSDKPWRCECGMWNRSDIIACCKCLKEKPLNTGE